MPSGTASWAATGASLTLAGCQRARSVFESKTVLHEIPGKAGDQGENLKRKSEIIYANGAAKGQTEFDNFRTQMKLLENATDATFTYNYAGVNAYNAVAVHVLHGEIELRKGSEAFLADWSVEMAIRE